ncbi:efflux RND transporter permease subunit [Solimonas soli]|uniref:efflux RND transporter permease subunit n=1 Tax=Solimonas soli TaxID=413479 RepID=UPI00048745DB|nr:efflux RND transporter permease subunit [Solimonas soli]
MKGALHRGVDGISDFLLGWRHLLSVVFLALTIFFGWSATRVQLDPGFLKMIPIKHEYMRTMMDYMKNFSGANNLLVNLRWKGEGDIYNAEFMEAMRKATDDVFLIPGIDRTHVSSIFTPNTYYIEITEDGFKGEPVVPARFSATPEQLARVRHNVSLSGQVGLLVANDYQAALIRADLQEADTGNPAKAEIFYRQVMNKLGDIRGRFESQTKYVYRLKVDRDGFKAGDVIDEGYVDYGWLLGSQTFFGVPHGGGEAVPFKGSELTVEKVKNPDYDPNLEVNIIGFAQLLADVIGGLVGVFAFFALAFLITLALLFFYSRSVRLTLAAIVVAMLPVLWLIGILPLIGFGIDPMSILVPFLIFSIGVSHAVQMTNAWRHEVVAGCTPVEASRAAFRKLFIPGAVALLTNALGFAVIMLIDIPIVHELGITACLGVLLMIITNKMILPIILTHIRLEERSRVHSLKPPGPRQMAIWKQMAKCAEPKPALAVFAICLALLAVTTQVSRSMVIGDSGTGAPELRQDSRYNHDNRAIADSYNIGTDVLSVIVEAKDFEGDSCLHYPVVNLIDRFELFMRGVDGVRSVTGVGGIGKLVISAFNEGNPRWRALPRSQVGLSTGSRAFDPNLGLNTDGCKAIQILVFMKDHEGANIAHALHEAKRFIEDNPVDGVKMRLASGNVGVMAATNEAVEAAEAKMLLAIFGALALLCLITFRSWRATLCVLVPLTMVSIFCNALMASLGIGLKVATLPVVALGVGVGVDYGIYLFERIQHDLAKGLSFADAFREAMLARGVAAVFTAITMAIGVGTWTMSALKFQADMGLLLSFMFLVNMLGAICLLPALGAWLFRDRAAAALGARRLSEA